MFIRTERLFLRPAWAEDAHDLHAAIADERVVRNLAAAPWPYGIDDARGFIARPQDRRHPSLLITVPSANGSRLVGGVGLKAEQGRAELGYWLTPEVWGRGYATEAGRAVLRIASVLGHVRIGAYHFLDNPASGRVLEKLGFRYTGRISERPSAGRPGASLSREYTLCLGGGAQDDGASPSDDCDMGRRAA